MKLKLILVLLFVGPTCFSQQTDYVDFKTAKVDIISVDTVSNGIGGHVVYEFEILKDIDSVYLDAKGFKQIEGFFNEMIYHDYDGEHFTIKHKFLKGEKHKVDIGWFTQPKKAFYFIEKDGESQIWTQGQGKYTSNWLPSIDDMNEKIEFDISVTFNKEYEVIANGKLINKENSASTITWHYGMEQPMSSYLVALTIGKYDKKVQYSKRGIPLEMYHYPEDSLKFEPTYRYTKRIFDFLETEIGVPYPWQNYKMVPVKDFLYAGMENTSLNIYSDAFVVDSIGFVDRNFVNINAHELAHQWFGDLVTETSGTHHWLQEGFATYYALLAERDIFGDDYYYWRLYEYAQELLEQDKTGNSTSLLDPKSSSITFYKKGCWALHILRQEVGNKAFREAVKRYLLKHQYNNVETDYFIHEVEKSSGKDLDEFVDVWLVSKELPNDEILKVLNTSNYMREYIEITHDKVNSKFDSLSTIDISDRVKSKIVSLIPSKIKKETFNNSIEVRQAIAQNLIDIPLELKADYESLLNDKSYLTIETALFNLWRNFPKDREKYLNQTKDIIGFNDKNVRILWLTLALITKDYEPKQKSQYFKELTSYTSSKYGFEVRQNAFQYLNQIQACNDECKKNLQQATKHHNWRFKKFARALLEK